MDPWAVFTVAFAAVILHTWVTRRGSPHWYLGCIVPLLYGGVVAWMFMGRAFMLSFQIIVFGAALPIGLLVWLWRREGDDPPEQQSAPPQKQEE